MPPKKKSVTQKKDSTANLGFEATALRGSAIDPCEATLRSLSAATGNRWLAVDKLRNNMATAKPKRRGDSHPQAARRVGEARQYKHVVIGLIFLKYISDTFEDHRAKRVAGEVDYEWATCPQTSPAIGNMSRIFE